MNNYYERKCLLMFAKLYFTLWVYSYFSIFEILFVFNLQIHKTNEMVNEILESKWNTENWVNSLRKSPQHKYDIQDLGLYLIYPLDVWNIYLMFNFILMWFQCYLFSGTVIQSWFRYLKVVHISRSVYL